MEPVLICREAQASSLVGNLLLAMEARKMGKTAAVVLTGEALLAATQGTFLWPREFWPQDIRWGLADRAKAAGLPVTGRGQFRALDVNGVVRKAHEAGVEFFACPVWTPLLGLGDKLPAHVRPLDTAQALDLLAQAKTVVGSF